MSALEFDEVLERIVELLRREGRTSYGGLKRRFGLDDQYLEDIKVELIECRRIACDEQNRLLVLLDTGAEPSAALSMSEAAAALSPEFAATRGGERRQLTVAFVDLVGSTELSTRLDPEDLASVLAAYRDICGDCVRQLGGHVAQVLGDGVLAYFGYPAAHEDAAQRAVYAGFAIVDALRAARHTGQLEIDLAVRIGIHSGMVVVEDIAGGQRESPQSVALGETPNIASRVTALAEPNTVVVTAAMARLLRDEFTVESLGNQVLRGVPEPVALFRALEQKPRIPLSSGQGGPFVGRSADLSLLRGRFEDVSDGAGQVVTISGEPGLGKSRLLQVFRESLGAEPHLCWECQCSPYHVNTALYPITEFLKYQFAIAAGDSDAERLDLVRKNLPPELCDGEALALFAFLLSIDDPESRLSGYSPQQVRKKTIEALVTLMLAHADRQPVVFIVEDLQWSDPSTLEFLGMVVEQIPAVCGMLVLSFRSGFQTPWASREFTTVISLERLTRAQALALVDQIAIAKALPAELKAELLAKTDGVPLFIEELTRMVLGSSTINESASALCSRRAGTGFGIPESIRDLLMARLDQLGTAKELAQLCAVLGRSFGRELITAVWPHGEERLEHALSRLVEAGLLRRRGFARAATFTFKHALVQDAAYESMLRRVRRASHERVARILIQHFPQLALAEPEIVAHHLTEAGLAGQAVEYWHMAADRALHASANTEAIVHLEHALEQLRKSPESGERNQRELELLSKIRIPLMATQGYTSEQLVAVSDRAQVLCREVADLNALWPALWALWLYYTVRTETKVAEELKRELATIAVTSSDPWLHVALCLARGHAFWHGRFGEAHEQFSRAAALCEEACEQRQAHAAAKVFGQDPLVHALSYLSWIYWFMGQTTRSTQVSERAVDEARRLNEPHSLGLALAFASVCQQLHGATGRARAYADEAIALSTEHGFPFWLADGEIIRGWADAMDTSSPESIRRLEAGVSSWEALDAGLWHSHQLALLAEAHLKAGHASEGLNAIARARAVMHVSGECYYEAELLRLEGELELRRSSPDYHKARACFASAVDLARRQGSRGLESKAAMSAGCLDDRAHPRERIGA
jgi:class 3 adenylate cyclase/predicted ATPase